MRATTPNEEIDDIMKTVESLEESGLLIKVVDETIQNEGKEQKMDCLAYHQEH